jgi:hypothetical protein
MLSGEVRMSKKTLSKLALIGTAVVVACEGTVHVGNLDRASTNDGGGRWTAWVRILVHDSDDAVVSGANVTGTWDNADNTPTRTDMCVTDARGMCRVSYSDIPNRDGNILFRLNDVNLRGTTGGTTHTTKRPTTIRTGTRTTM